MLGGGHHEEHAPGHDGLRCGGRDLAKVLLRDLWVRGDVHLVIGDAVAVEAVRRRHARGGKGGHGAATAHGHIAEKELKIPEWGILFVLICGAGARCMGGVWRKRRTNRVPDAPSSGSGRQMRPTLNTGGLSSENCKPAFSMFSNEVTPRSETLAKQGSTDLAVDRLSNATRALGQSTCRICTSWTSYPASCSCSA